MPRVLLVERRDHLRDILRVRLEDEGFSVRETEDAETALAALSVDRFVAVIGDLLLPGGGARRILQAARERDADLPVLLIAPGGAADEGLEAIEAGAFDLLALPVDLDHVSVSLRRAIEHRRLLNENRWLRAELGARLRFPRIIGQSPVIAELGRRIRRVARGAQPVLLRGERGSGKSLFARAIHHLSSRRDGPFVTVDGRAPASAAGAVNLADQGTLFVREIGALGPEHQAELLPALDRACPDVRLVASSTRRLREVVARGGLLQDLYVRLAGQSVSILPLRERAEDIPLLAAHFLRLHGRGEGGDALEFSPEALASMRHHVWPGNVRELENAVERALMLAEGPTVEPGNLGLSPWIPRGGEGKRSA